MTPAATRLEEVLLTVPVRIAAISAAEAARVPMPGKWSKKQILGHLIDSAGNNHQRFVRAQVAPRLDFPEYQQESWVEVQAYATASWADLVSLWLQLNRHLLHIMRNTPEDRLSHAVSIGGKPPIPLSDVMKGYLDHMEHHLEQILDTE